MLTNIAVFVSGGGTNLQALLDAQGRGEIPSGRIALVIASQPTAYALTRAENAGVEALCICRKEYETQAAYEEAMHAALQARNIDMIVLAGFLSILSADFVRQYENRIINVHPSLIPSFCGKGFYGLKVHEAALSYGVKVTGATVHYVNEIPDGGQILLQKAVEIQSGDTPEVLQRRVMEQAEWILLPRATQMVCERLGKEKDGMDLVKYLSERTYPGRGILLGTSPSGKAVAAYFIMGRSDNSRNRVFVETEEGIRTQAHDPAKMQDPSLVIYAPVRKLGNRLIVTNGDQTDTVYDGMAAGKTMQEALESRCYEPDAPHFTPRISGLIDWDKDLQFTFSILKKEGEECVRPSFTYGAVPGEGYILHTYARNEEPLPTFEGEPAPMAIPEENAQALCDRIWDALDKDNRISLFVWTLDLKTGETEKVIRNRFA